MMRISLILFHAFLIGVGVVAWTDAAWFSPTAPGARPGYTAFVFPERKEVHLANVWSALEEASNAGDADREVLSGFAVETARAALREGPANGYAWLALAWAEEISGRTGPAREALLTSWLWAPHSRSLAVPRVALGSRHWNELPDDARSRLLAEMRLARQANPAWFNEFVDDNNRIRTLWRLAIAQKLDRQAIPVRRTQGAS